MRDQTTKGHGGAVRETKLREAMEDSDAFVLHGLDVMLQMHRKYPMETQPTTTTARGSPPPPTFEGDDNGYTSTNSDDDPNETYIRVALDAEGIPLFHIPFLPEAATAPVPTSVHAPVRSIPPRTEDHIRVNGKRAFSQVTTLWVDLPDELRRAFAPLLKTGKNKAGKSTGYLNVKPQPGLGNGFQVQFWNRETQKHVRLGTVTDEKVGALMYAAATIDKTLFSEALVCRDWLINMIFDAQFRSEWLNRHATN